MSRQNQKGQALILVVVALGLVLIGAMGLVIDGAQIYTNHVMGQVAADAAAQAGAMSMFTGTSVTGANPFGTGTSPSGFNCTTSDARTPCVYARYNGFGSTASDTVAISFPTSLPGVALSASPDPANTANAIQVTITRTLTTGLMQLLGSSTSTAKAIGVAAIVDKVSPVPIIILHPTLAGAFSINGSDTVTICGGPDRSIQVNSSNAASISVSGGSNTVDLSKAGPADPGNCSTGTGADFGDFGGPATQPFGSLLLGTTGHYLQPASPINDPLATVAAPSQPAAGLTQLILSSSATRYGCPPLMGCTLYGPGYYASGIKVKNDFALFTPGLYYLGSNGFSMDSNSNAIMATGTATPYPTGFSNGGMLIYNTGNHSGDTININSNAGKNAPGIVLVGSDPTSAYKGMLFFEDRTMPALSHSLQGGATMSLTGTIYLTNTVPTMTTTAAHHQSLSLGGGPGSSTTITGEIIVDTLSLGGNSAITMNLNPNSTLHIRQVALVR